MSVRGITLLAAASIPLALLGGAVAQESSPASVHDALAALRRGDAATAASIATDLLQRPGAPDRDAIWIRARARDRLEEYPGAAADLEHLARLEPRKAGIWVALGGARFKSGDMDGSVAAFDEAIALDKALEPGLWQRGISHYYAGKLDECIRQFEIHRTVNPQDVENSAWHFLCAARMDGLESARAGLIPVSRDGRIPMEQVFDLFAGRETETEVLRAAQDAAQAGHGNAPLFYAHLYIGLFQEAAGDDTRSEEHIRKALDIRMPTNYMWQVARIHMLLRGKPG